MTPNELQILLALNGNSRIEYAECEIFASEELYTCYIKSLSSEYPWAKYFNIIGHAELQWFAYIYSKDVINGRWLEAESLIATSYRWACMYAQHVIRGRFVDAESVIATDRLYAKMYNKKFGTNI